MSHELICTWLKIPADPWPPDHYTLLGLDPAEADPARIENHVHQRHESLLRYQLTHPEQVTEAMNRLAQAFNCLSDPAAKKAYDTAHFPERLPPPAPPVPSIPYKPNIPAPVPAPPVGSTPDPLAWLYGPWGQAGTDTVMSAPTTLEAPPTGITDPPPTSPLAGRLPAMAPPAPPPVPAPSPAPAAIEFGPEDPVVELAAFSAPARRGLGTKRALYYRISRTRQLIRAWIQLGNYVGEPGFSLTKKPDAIDLVRQLGLIRQLLQGFPPLLGQAGQPGYVVVVLARQQMIVQTFLALLPSQREALAKDWLKGLELLAAHRRFLRDELWALRRKGWIGRSFRVMKALFADQPGLWLLLLALLAVNFAYPLPTVLRVLQVVLVAAGLGGFVAYRTFFTRRAWLSRTRRSTGGSRPQKQTN